MSPPVQELPAAYKDCSFVLSAAYAVGGDMSPPYIAVPVNDEGLQLWQDRMMFAERDTIMDAVVNVTENWGIGRENRLLVSISADLRRFRALTEGKTVIMGRKTLESLPHSRPLPHRRNLILSRDPNYRVESAEVFSSVTALLEMVKEILPDEVCLIGGASLYEALLPYCSRAFVTKTLCRLPADRFFPNLDELPNWQVAAASEVMEENDTCFQYVDYLNRKPRAFGL